MPTHDTMDKDMSVLDKLIRKKISMSDLINLLKELSNFQ